MHKEKKKAKLTVWKKLRCIEVSAFVVNILIIKGPSK